MAPRLLFKRLHKNSSVGYHKNIVFLLAKFRKPSPLCPLPIFMYSIYKVRQNFCFGELVLANSDKHLNLSKYDLHYFL